MTEILDFQIYKDFLRERLVSYTQKAFKMIPELDKPNIIDIGCGSGASTMELARLSDGKILGLDIDESRIDRLTRKIEDEGLTERVKAVKCSMFDMDFPNDSFDIIWAEGSTFVIGFERALKEWQRYLRPKGFLITHEMTWARPDPPLEVYNYWTRFAPLWIRKITEYLEQITAFGYDLVGHFMLPDDIWWIKYYGPLEDRVQELRLKYADAPKSLELLNAEQQQIDMARQYHEWYRSVFFIMRKS